MSPRKPELAPTSLPASDMKALLGPPSLLEGEDAAAYDGLYERVRSAVGPRDAFELLKQTGAGKWAIVAETLAAELDTFERIDEMIARAEARRDAILREIERRRDTLARRSRDAASRIEDA